MTSQPDSASRILLWYLGRRIRARREAIEASPGVFADRHGYDRNLWGRIERGQQNVTVASLHRAAVALGASLGDLVDGLEEEVAANRDGVSPETGRPAGSVRRVAIPPPETDRRRRRDPRLAG